MLKFLKWSSGLVTLTFVLLLASYWSSLDRDFTHSRESALLPLFEPAIDEPLIQIEANGMRFRARTAGFGPDTDAKPLVILLHGMPSTSVTWIDLIPLLAKSGYRVIAFDQRGYSPGARPEGIEQYTGLKRVEDIIAVADATGAERFHLVGHDFGAVNSWLTTLLYPERILSVTALSSPHPRAFMDAYRENIEQKWLSWYIAAYQVPWIPELVYGAFDADRLWLGYETDPERKTLEHRKVFSEPGAMTAVLNWYRAFRLVGLNSRVLADPAIRRPTLFIWGNQDFSVARWTVERQEQFIEAPYRLLELDAGHWIVNDHFETVSSEIVQHLATYTPAVEQ